MLNCELYSVQTNDNDIKAFEENIDSIATMLYKKGIRVLYNTDVSPDPKELTRALYSSQKAIDSPDYYIFLNTLDTKDSSSFKSLFFNYIKDNESNKAKQTDQKDGRPKVKISSLSDLGNGYCGYCFQIDDRYYVVLPQASLVDCDITQLVEKAVDKATVIFEKNASELDGGYTYIGSTSTEKTTDKKEGFIKSFIPSKTDTKKQKIKKWVVLAAMLVFLIALGYVVNEYVIAPMLNKQITSEIHEIAYNNTDTTTDDDLPAQNWDALKKINKEIVGWIKLDDTVIDYPVLEHIGDDQYSQYYLNHTYKKSYSVYGSIFVDYRCTDSVNSKNVILHGHNMTDGTMFRPLMGYGDLEGDLEFYKKHPVIEFNTPEGDAKYKIISVFKTNTLYAHGEFFNYMQADFLSDAEFMNFVYNCKVRSLINTPVMVNEDDQLLTLSTCSYEYSNFRTVVVARKLREGEKAEVNTEIATLNPSPLFPDVYYSNHSAEKPKVLTFKKANKKGLINWYDGEGKLEGSETLTATVAANPTEPPTEKNSSGNSSSSTPEVVTYYEVKFVNWDGSEYYSQTVEKGKSVTIPSGTPGLPSDEYYNYTFTGWKTQGLDLNSVHYSMTIYPDFKATPK